MRRRFCVFLAALPVAVGLTAGVSVAQASAVINPHARCVGKLAFSLNQMGRQFGKPGLGGQTIAEAARQGLVGPGARSNDCTIHG